MRRPDRTPTCSFSRARPARTRSHAEAFHASSPSSTTRKAESKARLTAAEELTPPRSNPGGVRAKAPYEAGERRVEVTVDVGVSAQLGAARGAIAAVDVRSAAGEGAPLARLAGDALRGGDISGVETDDAGEGVGSDADGGGRERGRGGEEGERDAAVERESGDATALMVYVRAERTDAIGCRHHADVPPGQPPRRPRIARKRRHRREAS